MTRRENPCVKHFGAMLPVTIPFAAVALTGRLQPGFFSSIVTPGKMQIGIKKRRKEEAL